MKQNLLKTMLVGIGLLAGTMGTWAAETTTTFSSKGSAYVDASQSDVNLNGASQTSLSAYNAQYRDWGTNDGQLKMGSGAKVAFYKFTLADIKALSGTITKATLKFTSTGAGNCYNIRALGYNAEWEENTITYSNISNSSGTITGDVSATGSFQPLGTTDKLSASKHPHNFEIDVLSYLRSAVVADKEYVSFAIAINLTRELSIETASQLEITTTTAQITNYTVKFQDINGNTLKEDAVYECTVGDNVTASTEDMSDFYSTDKQTKYSYADGNQSIVAADGGNTITLIFNEIPKITVTVNAVNADGTILSEAISTVSGFEGETITAYWNKYINVNNTWFVTEAKSDEPYLGVKLTASATENVVYAPADIAYFVEAEDMLLSKSSAWAAATDVPDRFSNGSGYRLSANSYAYTEALSGGVYDLTIFSRHTKTSAQSLGLYVRSADGVLTDLGFDYTTTSGTEEHNAGTVIIPDGYSLVIYNDGNYNSNVLLDYIYLTKATATATIGSTGYATYCSNASLDFSEVTGLKAYVLTVDADGSTLTKQQITQAPANTGLLLEGTADASFTIPAIASAEAITANDLVGTTEAVALPADGTKAFYGLKALTDGNVGFVKINTAIEGGFTVLAGKAYLAIEASAAKANVFALDGETTGIDAVQTAGQNGSTLYNMMGMKVKNAAKGLYIMNGKKVIIK